MIIYLDILLALNLFVDFLLICATARIRQQPLKRWRAVVGAILGALSSLIILAPPLPAGWTVAYKLTTAAAMVATAFAFHSITNFFKNAVILFVISAVFAGICTAGYHILTPVGLLVQSGVVYYHVPPMLLIALTTISYGILCVFDRFTRKRAAYGSTFRVEIIDREHRVILQAMMDSGHSLQDCFSGSPVILVREAAIRPIRDRYDIATSGGCHGGRIRYIPFSSIGGDGVLAAFRPQQVLLHSNDRFVDISGVWIATITVLGHGEYDALIGPAVADMIYTASPHSTS